MTDTQDDDSQDYSQISKYSGKDVACNSTE